MGLLNHLRGNARSPAARSAGGWASPRPGDGLRGAPVRRRGRCHHIVTPSQPSRKDTDEGVPRSGGVDDLLHDHRRDRVHLGSVVDKSSAFPEGHHDAPSTGTFSQPAEQPGTGLIRGRQLRRLVFVDDEGIRGAVPGWRALGRGGGVDHQPRPGAGGECDRFLLSSRWYLVLRHDDPGLDVIDRKSDVGVGSLDDDYGVLPPANPPG